MPSELLKIENSNAVHLKIVIENSNMNFPLFHITKLFKNKKNISQ
jgi:hypothetical protein